MTRRIENQPLNRRQFCLLAIGAISGTVINSCNFMKESDTYGLKSSPEVDSKLLKQLLDLEAKYNRQDLQASPVRKEHLKLSAAIFSRYAGEKMSENNLVNSIEWLSPDEYAKTKATASSAAYTDEKTGKIRINTHARLFSNQLSNFARQAGFPYWSALTTARAFLYQHEWYHLAGVTNKKLAEEPIDLSKYYQHPLIFTHTYGFSIRSKNPNKEEYGTDNSLEEAFAYLMTSRLEKKLTGLSIKAERLEGVVGQVAEATNRGRQKFDELFNIKPEWIKDFQRFHRESDPFGFGMFLVNGTNYIFQNEQQKKQYSTDLIMSFTLEPTGAVFRDYLSHLK